MKKSWSSFLVITLYVLITALVGASFGAWMQGASWIAPVVIAGVCWVASLTLLILRRIHNAMLFPALLTSAIGAGFLIAAYLVGMQIAGDLTFYLVLAISMAVLFLPLIARMALSSIKDWGFFNAVSFVIWLPGFLLIELLALPYIMQAVGLALPAQYFLQILLLMIPYLGLVIGDIVPAEGFYNLAKHLVISMLIVLLILGGVAILAINLGTPVPAPEAVAQIVAAL